MIKAMKLLSHRKRLEKVLSGEKADRIPFSFWRHFPIDDQSPEGLARSVLEYQALYDFDFVKVTPSSSFCLSDYGIKDEWRGNPEGTRDYVSPLVKSPKDINAIGILNPKKGGLGEQIKCLSLIKKNIPDSTPYIQTIFSPLAQLKNLVGRQNLPVFLRCFPDESKEMLSKITTTTKLFIEECKKEKIDGIFYAIQAATFEQLSENEYALFGKSYDLDILSTVQDLWLNVLHIHGTNIMFNLVKDYPCQIINWHDRESRPSLNEAQKFTSKVVCGGLRRIETMVLGDKDQILKEINDAYEQTGGLRWILSTGCVLMLTTPPGNIQAVKEVVQSL